MNKKVIALLLALVLVFGAAVGGTLAWLTDKTEAVVNTFTVGDINLELTEHKLDAATGELSETETTSTNRYNFVPGDTLGKDPWVTVKADSEPCYVFLKVTEKNNDNTELATKKVINFTVNEVKADKPDGVWTAVLNNAGYYYRIIDTKVAADTKLEILTGNQVTVSADITKAMAEAMEDNAPVLTFAAAAIQKDNVKGENGVENYMAAFNLIKADLDKIGAPTP